MTRGRGFDSGESSRTILFEFERTFHISVDDI